MDELKPLKLRLKYWRTRHAMSIRALSEVSGVSSATILKIEHNRYMPRPTVTTRLASALGIRVDELLIDEDERPKDERLLQTA